MIGELALAAVDALWEDLRLGAFPFPLEIRSHGETMPERARIKDAVYADLASRGLARGRRPVPELADALALLARPSVSIDAVAMLDMRDDTALKAVVAASGRDAVLAVQGERAVTLTPVRETAIAASIVDVLPAVRAGHGRSVTVPASAMGGGRPHQASAGGSITHPVRPSSQHQSTLNELKAIMQRPVVRAGQFGVTLRDERGRVRRSPGISWFDNDDGRYVTTVARGGDGEDWVTVAPADGPRLVRRLTEEISAVTRI